VAGTRIRRGLAMRTIKAPNEQGKIIECALLKARTWSYVLFEDINDYGAVYSYDADRNVFIREKFPMIM
jgi:hypothetical protein